jgi:hypothetical protein
LTLTYPNDPKLWSLLAFAENVVGDPANSVRMLESVVVEPGSEFITPTLDEAMATYTDALQAVGRDAEALDLANKQGIRLDTPLTTSWWITSHFACTRAQLGRIDDALAALENIKKSQGLALSPLLQDGLCFRRLAGDARYQGVLDHLEARQAALRARLPATLQQYGVADVRAVPRSPSR